MQNEAEVGHRSFRGTLAGLFACIIWSTSILAMSVLAPAFQPLRAAGYEMLMAGVFLLVIAGYQGNLRKILLHSLSCNLICGTLWVLNVTLVWFAVALARNSGELLVVGLLNYLWPAFTLLLAIPILKKHPTWWLIPGLIFVIAGIVIGKLSTATAVSISELSGNLNLAAYGVAILDALAWGFYSNFSRKLSNPAGASAVPFYMIAGGIVLVLASLLIDQPVKAIFIDWLILTVWALSSGLAYLGWDVGMRKGNIIAISSSSMLIPLFSTIITATMSGFGLSAELVLSATLVVAGSVICRKGVIK